ncbi:hypothetical protein FOB64_002581 [Candida albicans]|uniref:Bfr1p n=1 Tax=Candida albicans TaxID=5476 RepID=A0A8H6BZD6_CANAX|nr:hypothetical protein FOB64_002581 [Candida albicans]
MSSVKSATTSTSAAPRRREIKRPDDKAIKEEIEKLKDEIKKLDLTNNEINAQIAKAQIDQKVMDKRNKLQTELKSLIAKQSQGKNERQLINDQIKAIDASMKKRIAEIQQQTSKNNFKNVAEIDSRINYLDGLIDAGNLKLADERRFVKEMSSLRKLRKDFGSIEKTQELIDQDKAKIAELKKKLSATHNKEVQAQFETIQKELDAINESTRPLFLKETNCKQLAEEKKRRDEEYKQRLLEEKQQKKKEQAEKELAEASIPAFTEEINSIHTLLSYFDPSYVKPTKKTETNGALPINNNIRKVEFPEDFVVIKKEQEEFFAGTKGKKGKQHQKKSTKHKNFTVAPEVVVALSDLTIAFPTKEEEVPETIKTLKETLTALEEKQEEQTKINIERAKARIAKLEAEEDKEEEFETTAEEKDQKVEEQSTDA